MKCSRTNGTSRLSCNSSRVQKVEKKKVRIVAVEWKSLVQCYLKLSSVFSPKALLHLLNPQTLSLQPAERESASVSFLQQQLASHQPCLADGRVRLFIWFCFYLSTELRGIWVFLNPHKVFFRFNNPWNIFVTRLSVLWQCLMSSHSHLTASTHTPSSEL